MDEELADDDTAVKAIITFASASDKEKVTQVISGLDEGIVSISEYKEPMVKGTIGTSIYLHPLFFEQLREQLQSLLPSAIITPANANDEGLLRVLYFSIPAVDQHHLLQVPETWSEGPGGHIRLLTLVQDKQQLSLACPRCFSCEHKLQECKLPKDRAKCGLCGKEGHSVKECTTPESERIKQCLVCQGSHYTLSCRRLHPDRKPVDKVRMQQLADRAATKNSARQPRLTAAPVSSHHLASPPTTPVTYANVATASISSSPPTTSTALLNVISSPATHVAPSSPPSPNLEFQRMWKAINDIKQRQEEQEQRQVDLVQDLMTQNLKMVSSLLDNKMNFLLEQVATQIQNKLAITNNSQPTINSNYSNSTQRTIRHLPDEASSSHKALKNNQATDAAQSSRNNDTNINEQQLTTPPNSSSSCLSQPNQ